VKQELGLLWVRCNYYYLIGTSTHLKIFGWQRFIYFSISSALMVSHTVCLLSRHAPLTVALPGIDFYRRKVTMKLNAAASVGSFH